MSAVIPSSQGINLPQVLVAGLEGMLLSGGPKHSLVLAGSVGLSNLIPTYTVGSMWGSGTEKYLVEPIVAGLLNIIGSKFLTRGSGEKSALKCFSKGFVVGSSSAAIAGSLSSVYVGGVPSQYSAKTGLRAPSVGFSYPTFTVS